MKNFNDTTGERIRKLPACSAVSQPTAPHRVPTSIVITLIPREKENFLAVGMILCTVSDHCYTDLFLLVYHTFQNHKMECVSVVSVYKFNTYA